MAKGVVVSVRLPEELHEKVKEEADRGELTVGQWLIEAAKSKLRDNEASPYAADVARLKPLYAGVPFTPNASTKPRLKGYDAITGEAIYEAAPAARLKTAKEKSK